MAIQNVNETGIGELIRNQRKKLKITQMNLSELMSTERSAISKWEKGINFPPIDKVADLCEILHVEPNEFFQKMVDIGQIRREKRKMQETQNKDRQIFQTETEAIGGFRAIVNERKAIEKNGDQEKLEKWELDNDFYFLYDKKLDTFEGIRSYNKGIFPEEYLFISRYMPVSYLWMMNVNLSVDIETGEVISSKEEDHNIMEELHNAVADIESDMEAIRKLQQEMGKPVLVLTGHMIYNNYFAVNPDTQEGYFVFDYKSYTNNHTIIHADKEEKEENPDSFNIYIPSSRLRAVCSLSVFGFILEYKQCWDKYIVREKFETPENIKKALINIRGHQAQLGKKYENVDFEEQWNVIVEVMDKLRGSDYNPYFVNDSIQAFEYSYQTLLNSSMIGAPDVLIANIVNTLYHNSLKVQYGLNISEKYQEAEVRWGRKEASATEERLLRIIFGADRENTCIHEPRPATIPEEDIRKAHNLFNAIIKDKESEQYKIMDSYTKRIVDAWNNTMHNESEALKWCLYKVYDELKDSKLKDVVTFIFPVMLMEKFYKCENENLQQKQKNIALLQVRKFRAGIDEIERGSDK